MKTRIISAVVALPMVIIPLYLGGILLYAIMLTALLIGLHEFNRAFGVRSKVIFSMQAISSVVMLLVIWYQKEAFYYSAGVFLIIFSLILYVIVYPKLEIKDVFYGLIGFNYIVVMICHVILVRDVKTYGSLMVWMIFIIAFGSDSSAYFFGVLFGKHQLAKVLSPKKTIEGAIGGIVGSSILSVVYALIIPNAVLLFEWYHYVGFALMGAIGSVFSQFGDIAASAMKRAAKIKDFGTIMPGHGGIIDRMDSIIFVAPFVYYALLFILKEFNV
jgi:phosphatidate cytidylyltransferase